MRTKILLGLWVISGLALFLYSFTQVDLSLTFSQVSIYQTAEKWFQYVGWFNRPLSAALFLTIFAVLFILYGLTLKLVYKKEINEKKVFKIVIFLSIILFFAYNAFSYDLFNYIFDAKILVHYHQNPYLHKALDFPGDPMLSFMHWTHRTYPYGPVWLAVTAPIYFIGFNIFSLTFYLFKLLMAVSFVVSAYLISRIAKKMDLDPAFSVAAFALNPLVLAECLVSAHNDIVMMMFALLSIFSFVEKKHFLSAVSLLLSILIKFATVLLIPGILIKKFTKISNEKFILILALSMALAVIFATLRTNFQPWYLLYFLPFAAFLQNKYYILIPVVVLSIGALLQYLPYLYLGNYDGNVPFIMNATMIGSIIVSVLLVGVWKVLKTK